MSESELIKRSQERTSDGRPTSGAQKAFGELYLAYQHRILTFLAYTLGNIDQAEDLTQDTFLKAWKTIGAFKDTSESNALPARSGFAAWLYVIARREFYQYLRKRRGRPQQEGLPDEMNEHEQTTTRYLSHQPFEEGVMLQDEISTILRQLAPRQRMLLLLAHKAGFSYAEIAQILGTNVSAVSVGLWRAKQRFSDLYNKQQVLTTGLAKKGERAQ